MLEITPEAQYEGLLADTLADIEASEPEDVLEPGYIGDVIDTSITAWFVAYRTS